MARKRPATSDELKDVIVRVMSKYKNTAMSVQRISLLVSFENHGLATSWKTIQKYVDQLMKERKIKSTKGTPDTNGIVSTEYQLKI